MTDENVTVKVLDYGIPRRSRPVLREVSYKELKSGRMEILGKTVKVSPLSSLKGAVEIAEILKKWIEDGKFYLSKPVENLPRDSVFKPMKEKAVAKRIV
jgi:uncharacterized protein (DUF39 family)